MRVTRALRAAEGWLTLKAPGHAWDELEGLSPHEQAHPDVCSMRCRIYMESGRLMEASILLDALRQTVPLLGEMHFLLARIAARQGRTDEALSHVRLAMRLDPGLQQAMLDCTDLAVLWGLG